MYYYNYFPLIITLLHRTTRRKGLLLVIMGAIFWGVGGTVAQKLFHQSKIDVNWLVTTRLLIAGFLLLRIQFFWKKPFSSFCRLEK